MNVQQSSFASSIEETPHRDQPVNDVKCHDRLSGEPWQQACVHSQCGSRQQDPAVVATPVQQVDDSTTPCCDHEVVDRNGHAFDVSPQTGTVNDDACGRCRRDGSHAGSDVQHGDREETVGEGTQVQEAKLQGKCGELRADLRMQHSSFSPEGQRSSLPSLSAKCGDLELQCGSEFNGLSSGSELFLRTDPNSVHLQEGGTQLHASVPQVPKTAGVWEPMRVLQVDRGHEGPRIRKDVSPTCYFGEVAKAQEHKEHVKQALRNRLLKLRNRRTNGSTVTFQQSKDQGIQEGRPLSSRLEQSRIQCISEDANLSSMWTTGSHQVQGSDHSAAMGRTTGQVFQDLKVQEGASSISESVSLKPGVRKRLLGDLQKAIDAIDTKVEHPDDTLENLTSKELQDLMHLRLIGEVFSPDRFASSASRFDLQPGRAFDLQLGDQLLCPKQRKACLDHIRQKQYGLVVVTPICEMFSLLQYLGIGRSKESCQADPKFQEKMRKAKILLNFAALVCHVQAQMGGSFLFEQPWNALSWQEPCIRRLLQCPKHLLVRTDQCMFGQSDSDGKYNRKRTGFMTNNQYVAKALKKTCKKEHQHQACVGSSHGQRRSTQAARYTGALISAVLKAYARSCNSENEMATQPLLMSEIRWPSDTHGSSEAAQVTQKLQMRDDQPVFHDVLFQNHDDQTAVVVDPTQVSVQEIETNVCEAFPVHESASAIAEMSPHPALSEEENNQVQMLSPAQRKALMTEIEKAHRGMGHPHQSRFLRILKLGRATPAALGLAKTFECSQCKESTRPKPWRRAAPPRELSFNEVVGIDTVTIKHYVHNIKCLNVICWGTRYQMIVPLTGTTAFHARIAYRQWVKLFGAPKLLKPDMGTEFLGDFLYRCATDGTKVDPSSLESPTQNSITEREGGAFKAMYSKASLDYGPTDDIQEICELIDVVNMYKNRLCHRSGFSAVQRVFGYTPSIPGDIAMHRSEENNLMHHARLQAGDVTLQKQQRMRECAGKAFFSAECTEALRRAVYSGHRTIEQFEIGQMVYFWSVGQFNKVAVHHSATRRPNHAFWHGPCRVIATQYPTSIYLAYHGRL